MIYCIKRRKLCAVYNVLYMQYKSENCYHLSPFLFSMHITVPYLLMMERLRFLRVINSKYF